MNVKPKLFLQVNNFDDGKLMKNQHKKGFLKIKGINL